LKASSDQFLSVFSSLDWSNIDWNSIDIKAHLESKCNSLNIKIGKIMPDLRRNALVGGISGPDLITTMLILGKDETINRISNFLKKSQIKTLSL
jgi:glutamyl-tRNA synthetase